MIQAAPIGWWNTGAPLLVLGLFAVALPWIFAPASTRSQAVVIRGIVLAVLGLLVIGAALFAGIYAADGAGVGAAFVAAPLGTAAFFLGQSLYGALLWGPILLLVWMSRAQRVERLKGEDLARRHDGRSRERTRA